MNANIPKLTAIPAHAGARPAPAGQDGGKQTQTKPEAATSQTVEPVKTEPPPQQPMLAADLRIEVDRVAGRFVQTFIDPETGAEIRRFPNEAQLAFSRAVGTMSRSRIDVET